MTGRGWQQEEFDRLGTLTATDLEALVGASLQLVEHGGELRVVAVDRLGPADDRPAGARDGDGPFDVVLDAAAATDLPQGMHGVDVPGHGVVPLFLVPLGVSEDRRRYVASFG